MNKHNKNDYIDNQKIVFLPSEVNLNHLDPCSYKDTASNIPSGQSYQVFTLPEIRLQKKSA